ELFEAVLVLARARCDGPVHDRGERVSHRNTKVAVLCRVELGDPGGSFGGRAGGLEMLFGPAAHDPVDGRDLFSHQIDPRGLASRIPAMSSSKSVIRMYRAA